MIKIIVIFSCTISSGDIIISLATGQKQVWNPAVESQAFLQLAKLCQDHTLVGMKLLDKISSVPRGELSCSE